jgi:hypothetical protein
MFDAAALGGPPEYEEATIFDPPSPCRYPDRIPAISLRMWEFKAIPYAITDAEC